MSKYFGTDGFRGEANVTLTVDHAFQVGRFLGWYYNQHEGHKAQIVIGKDTRRSSYMFECALSAGITASGADVYLMHVTTTPSVSYIAKIDEFDCGIMISASHNPFHDNGIKLINRHGEKMEQEVIDRIEEYLDSGRDLPYATGEEIGRVIDYASGRNRYIGYLISLATHSYKDMKVALDCANGSAWMIAKSVFEALGAETYVLSNTPNGININDNCGSTHIGQLQEYVKANHMDIGFAFDGDADRCLAVDEKGNLVDGDGILYIYGVYMKEREKLVNNTVVTTIMSNFGLYKAFDALGIEYEKTDVGDKYVYECMRAKGHLIGGEQSGHIIFGKYANTGDGILTAIKLMQAMLSRKLPLSKLTQDLKIYPQVLKNVKVQDKERALNDFAVQNAVREVSERLGDQGRILLRKSGTEPVLRVMVEAPTHELCQENVDAVIAVMEQRGLVLEVKS
ncbi:MAG TPA: phosphoglucosamine mutase [Candidatus Evtepia faecigallinarum]|nr:phosphoglucosamine mutase [Candidatus Evtepia faecigallinarum]